MDATVDRISSDCITQRRLIGPWNVFAHGRAGPVDDVGRAFTGIMGLKYRIQVRRAIQHAFE